MPSRLTSGQPVRVVCDIRRKAPELPRYVVIPAGAVSAWRITATTVVEVVLGDAEIGRRSLKPWDRRRVAWFMDLPQSACRAAGVDTGDRVRLTLRRASTDLPLELAELLETDEAAAARWRSLTPGRRRSLRERVAEARKPQTRVRRARGGLLGK